MAVFSPRRCAAVVMLCAALVFLIVGAARPRLGEVEAYEARAPTPLELTPGVEAAFPRESYAPGSLASLVLFKPVRGVTAQVFHVGSERTVTVGYNEMQGIPVTAARRAGTLKKSDVVRMRLGAWPSGLYFVRLESADGLTGFAPLVIHPHRLGEHRVAVVMPTRTWQAYNLRDDDGDGIGNSWYARWKIHTATLGRPFLNRGVPYNFRRYDLPFLHWLSRTHKQVDVLADADLEAARDGAVLARAYDLIVFPSHHEYVTTHEYDVVEQYRDLGGNLIFLYANNFFWQTVKRGKVLERTKLWRDLGRPEAALIGVQYRGSDGGHHKAPWIVRNAPAGRWLFAGTGLHQGSRLGEGSVEIDRTFPASPKNVQVLAEIPNLFGPGFTAQMTYYDTPNGARVFAAGAFRLLQEPLSPLVSRLLDNLWLHLASDGTPS
jgi:hypothetical protein